MLTLPRGHIAQFIAMNLPFWRSNDACLTQQSAVKISRNRAGRRISGLRFGQQEQLGQRSFEATTHKKKLLDVAKPDKLF